MAYQVPRETRASQGEGQAKHEPGKGRCGPVPHTFFQFFCEREPKWLSSKSAAPNCADLGTVKRLGTPP